MKQGLLLAALVSLTASAPPSLPLPHNGRIAYVEPADVALPGLARIDATGKGRSLVDGGDIRTAVMSPDGTRLAYQNDENLIVARAAGGARTRIASGALPTWSPDSRRLAFYGATGGVEVAAASGVGAPRVVAAGSDPVWSPTGSWIAFYGPNQTLAIVHPDGSGLTTVAAGAFQIDEAPPAWSADGKWLSFSAIDSTTTQVGTDVVALDGSNRHTLGGSDPAWSPRSDIVAFNADAGLGFATADGHLLGTAAYTGGHPAWSPDGREVAVGDAGILALVDPTTFAVTRLTGSGSPVWSRDGTRIATVVRRTLAIVTVSSGRRHVLAVDAVERPPLWAANGRLVYFALASSRDTIAATALGDGKDSPLVRSAATVTPPPDFVQLTWSPNGRELAFNRVTAATSDLELVGADGRGRRVLLRRAGEATWSPDSRRLAVSFDGIEVVDARTGVVRRLTHGNDSSPAWSPNGKWIAFTRGDSLDVIGAGGGRFHRLARDVSSNPSWSPDGRRLVFSTGAPYDATAVETIAVDGSGLRVLAAAPSTDDTGTGPVLSDPRWSPDGRLIVFEREVYLCGSKCSELYLDVIRPDGTGRSTLRFYLSGPVWSPDGRQLFGQDESSELVARTLSGRTTVALPGDATSASWQPAPR